MELIGEPRERVAVGSDRSEGDRGAKGVEIVGAAPKSNGLARQPRDSTLDQKDVHSRGDRRFGPLG